MESNAILIITAIILLPICLIFFYYIYKLQLCCANSQQMVKILISNVPHTPSRSSVFYVPIEPLPECPAATFPQPEFRRHFTPLHTTEDDSCEKFSVNSLYGGLNQAESVACSCSTLCQPGMMSRDMDVCRCGQSPEVHQVMAPLQDTEVQQTMAAPQDQEVQQAMAALQDQEVQQAMAGQHNTFTKLQDQPPYCRDFFEEHIYEAVDDQAYFNSLPVDAVLQRPVYKSKHEITKKEVNTQA